MTLSKKGLLAILLPIQIILLKLLAMFPSFIERYYSNGIYSIISKTSRYILGWIPFSVGDICYLLLFFMITRWLYKNIKKIYKKEQLLTITSFLSVIYFLFHFLWGLNYYRLPLHNSLGLEKEYTTKELIITTKSFIEKANHIHLKTVRNDSLKVSIPYNRNKIFLKTTNAYKNLENIFPELKYQPRSIKKSILSLPLTYMGFSGYLNPFTNEAQVNYLIPKYYFPFVSCHEEAHQLGFAAENETNFIGCLATMSSTDLYFQYSGTVSALRYCLREVYKRDKTLYDDLLKTINKGILANYKESRDFWDSYQNPIEPLFKSSYDTFLKANNQSNGIKSYSYVVALLVNYELYYSKETN
ncbi:DUF3810 domain-containing protein [Pseudofulvibacter geojedonensis]|uniref:DUF3810 domain-containing protein n=1 Tax=Pseudofulvibacter geojedonensis TaxID=1123758 RepID=A0ABW3I234_9FLAO